MFSRRLLHHFVYFPPPQKINQTSPCKMWSLLLVHLSFLVLFLLCAPPPSSNHVLAFIDGCELVYDPDKPFDVRFNCGSHVAKKQKQAKLKQDGVLREGKHFWREPSGLVCYDAQETKNQCFGAVGPACSVCVKSNDVNDVVCFHRPVSVLCDG